MQVLRNPQQPLLFCGYRGTCSESVRTINNFVFNLYIQLIIAGLKTGLHLTPFCLRDLIFAIIKEENFMYKISGFVRLLIKTFLSLDLQFDFPLFLNILSLFFKFRVKNHLHNYGTQRNDK